MTFHGLRDRDEPSIHYEVFGDFTAASDQDIEGHAYRGKYGYLFRDSEGVGWWIIFAARARGGAVTVSTAGDVVACARMDEEGTMRVRVLASAISRQDADEAFQRTPPDSFEAAAALARELRPAGM